MDREGLAIGRREGRVGHDRAVERDDGRHALDGQLGQGAAGALDRLLAGAAGDDELGDHRVERPGDRVALDDAGVPAHARSLRHDHAAHGARCGEEAATGVLAVDPELDRVGVRLGVAVVEGLAVRDAELLAHEVDAGDLLGHGVLDLQAGVDLEEADVTGRADEELARAGADVAGLLEDGLARAQQLGVLLLGEERRGRLLDELLVAALERAVAGRDDDDVAVLVGEALGLDVARVVEEALDEALAAAEGRHGLADRRVVEVGDLLHGAGDLEAASAAAVCRLDRHGEAVLLGELDDLVGAGDRVLRAGHERGAGLRRDVARLDLVAEGVDRLGAGADPDEARVDHGLGEGRVLGEEAVAGVDGVGAGLAGDVEQLLLDEVALAGGRAPEGVRLVGDLDVQGIPVRVGVDRDRGDPAVRARPRDADGDLTTVCDQDLADGWHGSDSIGPTSASLRCCPVER